MSMYEIEIKSLLGSPENAEALRARMRELDPDTTLQTQHKQLNHYFEGIDHEALFQAIAPLISEDEQAKLKQILQEGSDFSIRTRLIDDTKLLFVVKASLDEGTSHNTVSRREFEAEITGLTIDELDQKILDAGFSYQAKWSREREEYVCSGSTICLDKNAGYGYLAEVEQVVDAEEKKEEALAKLTELMDSLGIEELPQDRLERMFAHYNAHWPDYYGTDKIFVVE